MCLVKNILLLKGHIFYDENTFLLQILCLNCTVCHSVQYISSPEKNKYIYLCPLFRRLCLHPNGRTPSTDHISLYLAIAETESLPKGWEVSVKIKMFVYNNNEDEYLTIEGTNLTSFYLL